jgi:hypothetical protein
MSPQLAAHLRLLETLPRRTHISEFVDPRVEWGCKRTPAQEESLKRELYALEDAGKTRKEMREITGCSFETIARTLRGRR